MRIRIRLTGRGYHVASSLPAELELDDQAGLADALRVLSEQCDGLLTASMMVLVDGRHVGTVGSYEPTPLQEGSELELLAPVAGG